MSYPKSVDKFIPWTKAMVAGATLDKPNYGKGSRMRIRRNRRARRRRRRNGKDG